MNLTSQSALWLFMRLLNQSTSKNNPSLFTYVHFGYFQYLFILYWSYSGNPHTACCLIVLKDTSTEPATWGIKAHLSVGIISPTLGINIYNVTLKVHIVSYDYCMTRNITMVYTCIYCSPIYFNYHARMHVCNVVCLL